MKTLLLHRLSIMNDKAYDSRDNSSLYGLYALYATFIDIYPVYVYVSAVGIVLLTGARSYLAAPVSRSC
jgi:hypothetical protein